LESTIGNAKTESVVAGCITPLNAGTAIKGIPTPSTPFDVPATKNAIKTSAIAAGVGSKGNIRTVLAALNARTHLENARP